MIMCANIHIARTEQPNEDYDRIECQSEGLRGIDFGIHLNGYVYQIQIVSDLC